MNTLYFCVDPKQKYVLSHIRIHLRKFQITRNLNYEGHLIVNLLGCNIKTEDIRNNVSKSGICLKYTDDRCTFMNILVTTNIKPNCEPSIKLSVPCYIHILVFFIDEKFSLDVYFEIYLERSILRISCNRMNDHAL